MDGKELAMFIDEEIRKRGLIKGKACEAMGITTATLSYWRTGKYQPTDKNIDEVEKYFGVHFQTRSENERVINSLQTLRDDVRGLLDVQRDMTPAQVESMMNFAKFLKSQGEGGEDAD